MDRKKSSIIGTILGLLIIQYVVLAIVESGGSAFWPAFTLPGFKKVYGANDLIEYTNYELVGRKNGETLIFPMTDLWEGIPTVQKRAIFRTAIKKADEQTVYVDKEQFAWYASSLGEVEGEISELFLRSKQYARSIADQSYIIQDSTITDYRIVRYEVD